MNRLLPHGIEPGNDDEVLTTVAGKTAWAPAAGPAETMWVPLTTTVGGAPELVWDGNDELVLMEVPVP